MSDIPAGHFLSRTFSPYPNHKPNPNFNPNSYTNSTNPYPTNSTLNSNAKPSRVGGNVRGGIVRRWIVQGVNCSFPHNNTIINYRNKAHGLKRQSVTIYYFSFTFYCFVLLYFFLLFRWIKTNIVSCITVIWADRLTSPHLSYIHIYLLTYLQAARLISFQLTQTDIL